MKNSYYIMAVMRLICVVLIPSALHLLGFFNEIPYLKILVSIFIIFFGVGTMIAMVINSATQRYSNPLEALRDQIGL